MVARATAALGEAVGKVFEKAVLESIRDLVEARGHSISPAKLVNGTGNVYQIDVVVFNSDDEPVIIIDPKYIRYTKHNRDKGSWLCVAHYNLRKTHRKIRKSIAVLAGRWSAPSKELVRSFGVGIFEVPFDHMAATLRPYGVEFDWPENGGEAIAQPALATFAKLDESVKHEIGEKMVANIREGIRKEVLQVLATDLESVATRVTGVEMVLKTDLGEMLGSSFPSVTEAMKALTDLVSDSPDIRPFIESRSN